MRTQRGIGNGEYETIGPTCGGTSQRAPRRVLRHNFGETGSQRVGVVLNRNKNWEIARGLDDLGGGAH